MNKSQIRLLLEKESIKISNNKIGEVAVSLGFGNNVDYSYSEPEAKQILNAIRQDFKQKEQPKASNPLPTDDSRALTKQIISQSSDALTGQIRTLATRMDESDRALARQLAGYVADRPQRFTIMFAEELNALISPVQETPQAFIDADLAVVEMPNLTADFLSLSSASAIGGALPASF